MILFQCEDLAGALADREPLLYARTLGCTQATAKREGMSTEVDQINIELLLRAQSLVSPQEWAAAEARGRQDNVVDLFRELAAKPLMQESE